MKKTMLGFEYFITIKQARVLIELSVWQAEQKRPPAIQDLADLLCLSRACVHEHLQRLLRDGFVEKRRRKYIVSAKGCEYLA